jgi:hypothetical protein
MGISATNGDMVFLITIDLLLGGGGAGLSNEFE